MKFFAGFVTAIIIMVVAAALVAWTYDVAASVPDTAIEFEVLRSIMRNYAVEHRLVFQTRDLAIVLGAARIDRANETRRPISVIDSIMERDGVSKFKQTV